MTRYEVVYSERAIKELKKLDKYTRQMIYAWIGKNLVGCENPRQHGRSLTASGGTESVIIALSVKSMIMNW